MLRFSTRRLLVATKHNRTPRNKRFGKATDRDLRKLVKGEAGGEKEKSVFAKEEAPVTFGASSLEEIRERDNAYFDKKARELYNKDAKKEVAEFFTRQAELKAGILDGRSDGESRRAEQTVSDVLREEERKLRGDDDAEWLRSGPSTTPAQPQTHGAEIAAFGATTTSTSCSSSGLSARRPPGPILPEEAPATASVVPRRALDPNRPPPRPRKNCKWLLRKQAEDQAEDVCTRTRTTSSAAAAFSKSPPSPSPSSAVPGPDASSTSATCTTTRPKMPPGYQRDPELLQKFFHRLTLSQDEKRHNFHLTNSLDPDFKAKEHLNWRVNRTAYGNLPVYDRYKRGGIDAYTVLKNIEGNHRALMKQLIHVCEAPVRMAGPGGE